MNKEYFILPYQLKIIDKNIYKNIINYLNEKNYNTNKKIILCEELIKIIFEKFPNFDIKNINKEINKYYISRHKEKKLDIYLEKRRNYMREYMKNKPKKKLTEEEKQKKNEYYKNYKKNNIINKDNNIIITSN